MTPEWDGMRRSWLQEDPRRLTLDVNLVRFVRRSMNRFDFQTRLRNNVHCGAILTLLILSGILFWRAESLAEIAAGVLLVGGAGAQAVILRRDGRVVPDPDPSGDALHYRQALAERFDRQLRYLRRSHTAGLVLLAGLALWAGGGVWDAYALGEERTLIRRGVVFCIVAGLYWANHFVAYRAHRRRLAEQRDELLDAWDRGESPEEPTRERILKLEDE